MTDRISIIQKKIEELEKKKKEIEHKTDLQYIKLLKTTLGDDLTLPLLAGILNDFKEAFKEDASTKTSLEKKGEAFLKDKPFRQQRSKTDQDQTTNKQI